MVTAGHAGATREPVHGFSEHWGAWRRQIQPLVDAGWHAGAPTSGATVHRGNPLGSAAVPWPRWRRRDGDCACAGRAPFQPCRPRLRALEGCAHTPAVRAPSAKSDSAATGQRGLSRGRFAMLDGYRTLPFALPCTDKVEARCASRGAMPTRRGSLSSPRPRCLTAGAAKLCTCRAPRTGCITRGRRT